ncbi:MAG TPA: 30S ribosome-binding factor RbfA [Polyangiaceae bacterium]|jgi:ribosome-binding factor A|nr:30S ribosome-binding factor RbfA [Polyangiaceae bacterium]
MATGEPGLRAKRVATQIRARLVELLARDVSDPIFSGVVVTSVELPDDLSIARVKARLLVGGEDAELRRKATRALSRASTRLRRALGSSLKLKRVPELRFEYDTGLDAAKRVDELLAEIAQDSKGTDK